MKISLSRKKNPICNPEPGDMERQLQCVCIVEVVVLQCVHDKQLTAKPLMMAIGTINAKSMIKTAFSPV